MGLRQTENEIVVKFANGYSWKSGSFDSEFAAGSYVRACAPDGEEIAYWSSDEWERHPRTVMKEIMEAVMDDPNDFGVALADGCHINSGADLSTPGNGLGEFIQINNRDGEEIAYWDKSEWQEDPVLVMGAIMCSASGFRPSIETQEINQTGSTDKFPAVCPTDSSFCCIEFPDVEIPNIPENFKSRMANPYVANPGRTEFDIIDYDGTPVKEAFEDLIKANLTFMGRTYRTEYENQNPEKFINFGGNFASALWDEWSEDLLARYDESTGQFDSDGSVQKFVDLKKQWLDYWNWFEADQEPDSGPGM
jgi:hypothetical protein